MNTIAVIGCGYVGLINGIVLAYKHRDKKFIFVDTDKNKIQALKERKPYINEPLFAGYLDIVNNANYTTDYNEISNADIIMVAVNTPDKDGKCDLHYLIHAVSMINEHAKVNATVIIKSTVAVGVCKYLAKNKIRHDLTIVSIPEFLAEGEAIKNVLYPSRVLIGFVGERDPETISRLGSLYYYVDEDKIVITDSNTAELAKLASNFMLAQRVSSINAIESLAVEKDANIVDISKILRMDPRIGGLYLSPSAGYGGSCFRKDVNNIANSCHDIVFGEYFMSVNRINDYHMSRVVSKIPNNSNVLFLGYGFKENSNDTRESPTQFIINCLPKTITYSIYDTHIEKYSTMPTEKYDYVVLMLNEKEYIDIAKTYPLDSIIDPRYILKQEQK